MRVDMVSQETYNFLARTHERLSSRYEGLLSRLSPQVVARQAKPSSGP